MKNLVELLSRVAEFLSFTHILQLLQLGKSSTYAAELRIPSIRPRKLPNRQRYSYTRAFQYSNITKNIRKGERFQLKSVWQSTRKFKRKSTKGPQRCREEAKPSSPCIRSALSQTADLTGTEAASENVNFRDKTTSKLPLLN